MKQLKSPSDLEELRKEIIAKKDPKRLAIAICISTGCQALGVNKVIEAFDEEIRPSATDIVVIDKETNTKYHTLVETFDRQKGELNRGFGRQYFLTLDYWQVEKNGNRQLSLWVGDM